jgi:hypothetical protein
LSAAKDRFRLVFDGSKKDITFTHIEAKEKGDDIVVKWKVKNEVNIESYDVETSGNGQQFIKAATVEPKGNDYSEANYHWLDVNAKPGVYYYRVRSTGSTGEIKYSDVVKVMITRGRPGIKVYPNPVTDGKINIQMINQPTGKYSFRLINGSGQVILMKEIMHLQGNNVETIKIGKNMVDENYRLDVTLPDNNTESLNVILQ